jgi:hypothetical protein
MAVLASSACAATFNVSNTVQLEEAVSKANANSQANTIVVAAGNYTPEGEPASTLDLKDKSGLQVIEGPAGSPTVNGTPAIINGSSVVPTFAPLFEVEHGVSATIKNLEIGAGGGQGTAAIEVEGSLGIEDSTLEGNTGQGVLVGDKGALTASNTTISEGLEFGLVVDGTASLFNVTVAYNGDGGIQRKGTLNLTNTIVAENTGKGDCVGAATTSDHSLDSNGSCGVGALSNKNPLLQPNLQNDGGTTPVHPLKSGSPAIYAGDSATCLTTDQRGAARATPCSIGAVEYSVGGLASGSFVIGEGQSQLGDAVTFWSELWPLFQTLHGGGSWPLDFSGFATSIPFNPPQCGAGTNWTSSLTPALFSEVPATVPELMAVIVSSSITGSQWTGYAGNTVGVDIIKTNAGYGPSWSYLGTGTVVAQVCSSGGPGVEPNSAAAAATGPTGGATDEPATTGAGTGATATGNNGATAAQGVAAVAGARGSHRRNGKRKVNRGKRGANGASGSHQWRPDRRK